MEIGSASGGLVVNDDISDIKRPFDCDMQNYFDFQEPDFDVTPIRAPGRELHLNYQQ
jgi:hypothetical protein